MAYERPKYFSQGIYSWDGVGYGFLKGAPSTLLAESALADRNPWISFSAILLRAQQGDFTALPKLIHCLQETDSWVLARAVATLLGDAGSSKLLRRVADEFHADLFVDEVFTYQIELAHAFSYSGLLWTVPLMLELHLKTIEDRDGEIIPILLSEMLEARSGAIATGARNTSEASYRDLVMGKFDALRRQLGSENPAVYYGEAFAVETVATRLYNELTKEPSNAIAIAGERHRFEASTGLDCEGFFVNRKPNRLQGAVILEDFLDGPDIAKFKPGMRYFFGHPIPD